MQDADNCCNSSTGRSRRPSGSSVSRRASACRTMFSSCRTFPGSSSCRSASKNSCADANGDPALRVRYFSRKCPSQDGRGHRAVHAARAPQSIGHLIRWKRSVRNEPARPIFSRSRLVAANDPNVHFDITIFAHAQHLAVLQHAQEFRLEHRIQFADLVQKQDACLRRTDQSFAVPLGARERSSAMAENSLSASDCYDRTTIHRTNGPVQRF